ncbi:Fusaric acid resistance protein-like-domain-containing protein [Xylariomycetidae sp. FL0641]|nr:Fusaric acid resistance protein-like-domain-containing protein [Xylariomycetidae sp. FL0641]
MSNNGSSAAAAESPRGGPASASRPGLPRPVRPPVRSKLRNGTWIIPSTGERSRRQFTLRRPSFDGPDDDEIMRSIAAGETLTEKAQNVLHNLKVAIRLLWAWLKSPNGRGTLKCSIAYLLASMGTFFHPAAKLLGPLDGKHIVATIVTYFHPARTVGSQLEAVAISVVAVCYAIIVGTCSMGVSVLFGDGLDMIELGHAIILVLFIGFGLGFLGWVKQKLNNPLVSVGVSIASIGIITIITKEPSIQVADFSNRKIIQYLKILLMATIISTAVNLLLWPVSARRALRKTMRNASVLLGDMLSLIAIAFLSGSEEEFGSEGFTKASSTYTKTLAQMNKNARESKYEYYLLGQEQVYKHDKTIVKSMEQLAQSLGGLKSAAITQFELLKEVSSGAMPAGSPLSPTRNPSAPMFGRSFTGSPRGGMHVTSLSAIDEALDERSDPEDGSRIPRVASPELLTPSGTTFRTPSDIFELFITRLGPSLKSLAHTMAEMLKAPPFGAPGVPVDSTEQFQDSLSEAVGLYNQARARALEELYTTIEFGRTKTESIQADFEEVAAACGHFSFSLLSFAEEMQRYMDAIDDLRNVTDVNKRTWNFLKFWRRFSLRWKSEEEDPEQESLLKPVKRMRQSKLPQGIPDAMKNRRNTLAWDSAPIEGLWNQVVRYISKNTLKFLTFLSRDDIRFGLKVGIGAIIYAMFAFIPETRGIYEHWRGEWGLLSFMIVCSVTVGASNATGLARFTGTVMGAALVILNWWIADGNPVGLALLGWAVSVGAFYIMVDRGNGPFGRFILLSYNVSSLYAYSLSQKVEDPDDDEGGVNPEIRQIAFHRVVAVGVGILWGLIICRLIWPMPARQKFKAGLSVLYLQMGLIWKRGPLSILLREDSHATTYLKVGELAAMQRYATQLQTLRAAAKTEYEVSGPFPFEAYGRVVASTQRIIDAFHAMSLVSEKHSQLTAGEKALLSHTAEEREQLCMRICHVFQVLASSFMLEYPLTDAIPSVAVIRDKLLGKIFRFRKEHNESLLGDDVGGQENGLEDGNGKGNGAMGKVPKPGNVTVEEPDYALLYAYALVTGQVAKELKVVEKEVEGLFGRLNEDALLLT